MNIISAAIGLRAQKGGAVLVAVAVDAGEPSVLMSRFLPTFTEGDRLAFEPYGVASEMPRGRDGQASPEAVAAVAEGRRRQDERAARELQMVMAELAAAGYAPALATLLVNRAGWISDLLSYSLGWPEHVPVAEGLAVREALRAGCRHCGLDLAEFDEKSLPERAADGLGQSAGQVEARLKALGAVAGKPWRKEQKLACLAAWLALAELQETT